MSVGDIVGGRRLVGLGKSSQQVRPAGLRMLASAVIAGMPVGLMAGRSALATTYQYTGATGTAASPVTGNFSTGFTPAISGATSSDVIDFAGGSQYTATNDLTSPLLINGFRVDGTPSLTVNQSAGGLIQLGGTNPFINFNNGTQSFNEPTYNTNFEFQSSGYIVKSSAPNYTADPIMTGNVTLDPGTVTTIALADTGGDSNAELNLSSSITGSGSIILQNNVGGLPGGVQAMAGTADWGTLQLAGTNNFTGGFNIAYGRVVTGVNNAFGTGTLTIGIGSGNSSGGSLELGGTNNNGNGGHTTGDGFVGTYGSLAPGVTGITLPNNMNLGGAINGDYGYAINNFSGNNTLSGNVTLTQTQIRIQANTGNTMLSNAGSTLTFSGNVSEGVTGALFNVSGGGNLTFSGTNTFTGGVNMSGGVLTFANAASLPATGTIYLNNAAFSAPGAFTSASAILTSGRISNTSTGAIAISANDSNNVDFTNYPTLGLGAALTGSPVTFSGSITPAGGIYRLGGGAGALYIPNGAVLSGSNSLVVGFPGSTGAVNLAAGATYTGQTNLSGGYLTVASGSIPAGSQIIGFGGGIRLLDGAGTDFPATRNIIDQGGLYLDTNGFNLTLNSPVIAGSTATASAVYGSFSKIGAGQLNVVSAMTVNNFFVNGTGSVYINGSSAVVTGHSYDSISQFPGDQVTMTIDNGALFTNNVNDFNVSDVAGSAAYGSPLASSTVSVLNTNGVSTPTQLSAGSIYIGKGSATNRNLATGVLNQGPGTVITSTGNVQVGVFGTGLYNQTGGSLTMTGNLTIGRDPSTIGIYNISGGSLNTGAGNIFVPEDGSGTLNISGTTTSVTTNRLVLARSTDAVTATGVVNQNGGTVNTTGAGSAGGILYGGTATGNSANNIASGTYNFNGGVLKTGSISQNTNVNGAIQGTFNFNGGTLQVSSGAATPFIGGLTAANIMAGGAIIDNGGQNLTFAQNFSHGSTVTGPDGGMQLLGTGVVTLTSTHSTYTGPTAITAGTLRLAAATTTVSTINQSSVQAYYSFENGNMNDSSQNSATNGLAQASTADGSSLQGNVAYNVSAPPSTSPAIGTATYVHTGSISLTNSAYLVNAQNSFPTGIPLNNSSYTLGAWIQGSGNNLNANGYGIVGWGTYGTTNTTIALRTANAGGGVNNAIDNYWWSNDLTGLVPGGGQSVVGVWHYIAATYDSTSNIRTLYVDGSVVAQDSPAAGHNAINANFAVGETNLNPAEYFDGNMADLIIASTAFTPGQLALAAENDSTGSFTTSTPGGQLPLTTTVQISSGATFDLNGNLQTIGGLTGPVGATANLGNGGILTVNNLVPNTFAGTFTNASSGGLTVNGTSTLTIGSATSSTIQVQSIGTVNVGGGAVLALSNASSHSGRSVLVTNSLLVSTTGTLDLSDNELVLNGSSPSLSTVTAMVAAGYNLAGGGRWNGPGITSSAAAANTLHLTALGVIQNNQSGTPLYGSGALFDGIAPEANAVLVKYTYFGDANLDGKVDGSDYSLIDAGYASHGSLTGWYNGDFNYDGVVDGSDYALLDNAYNNQGGQLSTPNALVASATAQVAGSAVPEPASLGLLAAGAAGLLARRRRAR